MSDIKMTEIIEQVKKALAEATNGPWKVYEKIYEEDKPYLAERLIGTAYDHPQLKGPDSIVSNSWCIYEPHNRVVIDKENAHLIANAPEWLSSLITTIESQNSQIESLKAITELAVKEKNDQLEELEKSYKYIGELQEENIELDADAAKDYTLQKSIIAIAVKGLNHYSTISERLYVDIKPDEPCVEWWLRQNETAKTTLSEIEKLQNE